MRAVLRDLTAGEPWFERDAVAFQASLRPSAPACHEFKSRVRLTYRELDQLIGQCAGWLLKALGNPHGVRVAMLSRNSVNFVLLNYACERTGAIFQPLNWRLSAAELRGLVEMASPRLFIYEEEFEDKTIEALRDFPITTVKIGAEVDRFRAGIDAAPALAGEPAGPDAPCLLLSTSGTTGRPKGVIVTRKNLFFSAVNFMFAGEITPATVQLCDLPMFHVAGLYSQVRATIFRGGMLYISDRFEPAVTLRRLSDPRLGITHYFFVPQIAQLLLDDPGFAHADFSRLKATFSGGAPMTASIVERFAERGVPVVNGLGMSEAGPILTAPLDLQAIRRKPASVGVAMHAMDVRIVTAQGRDAEVGQVGELWVRGPSVTPGYWKNPEATSAAFSDSWLKTGDAVIRDEDGFYTVVDRWKDMYISGGENVYPAEVESVILSVSGVADAGVVGVPDSRWGETGCAYVVRRAGAGVTGEEILAQCASKLASFKRPGSVRFVEELPRTASGKIRKDVLREQFGDSPAASPPRP